MRKKKFVLLLVFAFLNVGTIALLATATAAPAIDLGPEAIDLGPEAIDATPEMLGADEVAMRKHAAEVGAAVATGASLIGDPVFIGENLSLTVSDFVYGDYDENFTVIMEGTHGIILVEKDAYENYDEGTDEYVFANPSGTWRPEDRISTAQLTYLLGQFDSNIYPAVTGVFGDLIPRGDEGQKVWVLIHNIRDQAYYGYYEYYVAGYFSSSENAENNKNMFHIDSYDWFNRTGPDGTRPYLYEGTFAHEFEHMVHFDVDPDEPSWVDEGLADLASYLSGYGHSDGHIDYYFRRHMSTPLTFWGGGLEDYGASYLFQLYLFEKFGGAEFVSALVQEQANGIEGIENTLAAFGFTDSFDEIFDAWTIANYVDDTRKAGGKYGYETLEVGGPDTRGNTIEASIQADHAFWLGLYGVPVFPFYETPFIDTWWQFHPWLYGDPLPYTAQYFRFNSSKAASVWLDGQESTGITPYSGTYEWFSGDIAWAWRSFYQTFDFTSFLPGDTLTLNFMTLFEIEDDWDYAYVEVHDLITNEWVTLNDPSARMWIYNEITEVYDYAPMRDYVLNGQDNPNTPAGREPTDYEAAGAWFGFTGDSDGWIPISMDLTPFAGHEIELHFRLWQDGAFTLMNMFVDDISIPEIGFFDDVESGVDGWTPNGWVVSDGIFPNGWDMIVFDFKAKNNGMELGGIWGMEVDFATQDGVVEVPATPHKSGRLSIAVVANHANHLLRQYYAMGADFS